jgi:AcrR family transcriptional regulator
LDNRPIANTSGGAPPSLSRTRARTRAALIEAALALIAEKGFRGATLADIGERAGKSKGAVYSNFASKEDLFLAVAGSMNLVLRPKLEAGMSVRAVFRAIGEAVVALRPAATASAAFMAEYKLYALTHARMKSQLARRYAGPFRQIAMTFAENFEADQLPMPAADLPVVIQALALGFIEQSFLTPNAVTDELIVRTFEALAGTDPKAKS